MKTYILGHQKPDTDAVVSTLAFKHLFDSQACWQHSQSVACITDDLNPETEYLFKKFKQTNPQLIKASQIKPEDKVVLVDHNEVNQALKGLNYQQVTDIFDHHKLNLNLNQPIFITTKPWGSTCTIAWWLMNTFKINIPHKLAGLILAAILSDTVGFKSSTTTDVDKKAAQALAQIIDINIDNFTFEILKAKSNISSLSDDQIVTKDYKVYDFNGHKVFLNQLETVEQKKVIQTKKANLLKALKKLKQTQNYDYVFMAISDILKVNTKMLSLDSEEKNILETSFSDQIKDNLLDIGPKLSRKKDIAPFLEKTINNL